MQLAALASAAMPGLKIVGASSLGEKTREFDAALVTDSEGTQWRVRSPRDAQAAVKLETELEVLAGFTPAIRAKLPFRVPSISGAVQVQGLRTFIYHQLAGVPLTLEEITELPEIVRDDLGRITAAIHRLPASVVEIADLPQYSAKDFRNRRLNELDEASLTGKIPNLLLDRWEDAFENKEIWDFDTVVVHGALHEDHVLFDDGRPVAVTSWMDLQIADPALDFAWLAGFSDPQFSDDVVSAYLKYQQKYHRHPADVETEPDPEEETQLNDLKKQLLQRASLHAEFALAQYLMSGIAADDEQLIEQGHQLILELAANVEETGGQDVGVPQPEPEPQPAPEPEPEPEPESESDADSDPAVELRAVPDEDPDADPEADSDVASGADAEPAAEAETEAEASSEDPEDEDEVEEDSAVITDDDYEPVFFRITKDESVIDNDGDDAEDDQDAEASTKPVDDPEDPDVETPTAPLSLAQLNEMQQRRDAAVAESIGVDTETDTEAEPEK